MLPTTGPAVAGKSTPGPERARARGPQCRPTIASPTITSGLEPIHVEFPDRKLLSEQRSRDDCPGFLAYLANLECVKGVAPDVVRSIVQELADQRRNIKMIASENFSSLATQCAMANLLTDKYAEGIPHHRFYAGCDNVDSIEDLANQRARELFGAFHAYAQPHSGADANLVAFWAILRAKVELDEGRQGPRRRGPDALAPADWYKLTPEQWRVVRQALGNQRLLGMDLASGGHLTHGYRLNSSGKMFESHGYTVDRQTFLLDYDAIERQAVEVKPLILLAGFSAYSRNINYAPDAHDCRPGRRGPDGRHGPLRRLGGGKSPPGRV